MLTAQLLRPAGTGAHLSTSGVEFDEKILRFGPDCALRRGSTTSTRIHRIPGLNRMRRYTSKYMCAPHALGFFSFGDLHSQALL